MEIFAIEITASGGVQTWKKMAEISSDTLMLTYVTDTDKRISNIGAKKDAV